ncbi:hypothetical protein Trco_003923 [Trichoderma cornu-damae]|uniref:Uncharacterized protein n=1 Tax=Trichoderma cornu-damae TaxID=654480 RepID=A0A9P8QJP7_9HYPO|nr:hypothetical protein Trco_003923 [Trichoderma cornu-damae]
MTSQEPTPSPKYNSVELIPWDSNSDAHFQRLYEQRVACTWDMDLIGEWKEKALQGNKSLYWIKLGDHLAGKDEVLAKHLARYPKEKEAIVDTAAVVANSPRTPTSASFIPVGHVALDMYPDRNEKFSLPQSTVWIKSLYVSWAIQAGGFGRSAMYQVERLASLAPLNATVIALDTLTKEFQTIPENIALFAKIRGSELGEMRSNEEWYTRQGYQDIGRSEDTYKYTNPHTGDIVGVPLVYLKKDLV